MLSSLEWPGIVPDRSVGIRVRGHSQRIEQALTTLKDLPRAADSSLFSLPQHGLPTSKTLADNGAAHPLTHADDLVSRETTNIPQYQ